MATVGQATAALGAVHFLVVARPKVEVQGVLVGLMAAEVLQHWRLPAASPVDLAALALLV
jgi:hypothetical protein